MITRLLHNLRSSDPSQDFWNWEKNTTFALSMLPQGNPGRGASASYGDTPREAVLRV